jgi:hypothetical protein
MQLDCECLQFFPANEHSTISPCVILSSLHEWCCSCHHVYSLQVEGIIYLTHNLASCKVWKLWFFWCSSSASVLVAVVTSRTYYVFLFVKMWGVCYFSTVCGITRWFLDCIFMSGTTAFTLFHAFLFEVVTIELDVMFCWLCHCWKHF